MASRGKTYEAAAQKIDSRQAYSIEEAFNMVVDTKRAKFDESIDVAINLGVDPKHSDQMVRGVVSLPHGTGKTLRVIVFAKGEKETEAKDAGADEVGADDLIAKIEKGWLDFDAAIATPDMMRDVSRVAKVLGPRGLMPNPKTGTVTFDVGDAVKATKAGRIEFRVEKAGIIHTAIGKASFKAEQLRENFMALMESLAKAKPSSAKGIYFKGVTVSTTMGPGIAVDTIEIAKAFN